MKKFEGKRIVKLWSNKTINSTTLGPFFNINDAVFLLHDKLKNDPVCSRTQSGHVRINLFKYYTSQLWEHVKKFFLGSNCERKIKMFSPSLKIRRSPFATHRERDWVTLTLYTLTSACIFSLLLYAFPEVLTRRICLKIKCFFSSWSFPLFMSP